MKTSRLLFFVMTVFVGFSCNQQHSSPSLWTVAYKNDKEGNTLMGSKEKLINAIRSGASIKIGWGAQGKKHTIEHLSEPIWIAVLDEKEVLAHLDPQVLSGIEWQDLTATYTDSLLVQSEWRVVLTTKGEFDAVWIDRNDHTVIKRWPQNHPMTWFVKDIDPKNVKKAFSLFQTDNEQE